MRLVVFAVEKKLSHTCFDCFFSLNFLLPFLSSCFKSNSNSFIKLLFGTWIGWSIPSSSNTLYSIMWQIGKEGSLRKETTVFLLPPSPRWSIILNQLKADTSIWCTKFVQLKTEDFLFLPVNESFRENVYFLSHSFFSPSSSTLLLFKLKTSIQVTQSWWSFLRSKRICNVYFIVLNDQPRTRIGGITPNILLFLRNHLPFQQLFIPVQYGLFYWCTYKVDFLKN